MKKLVLQVPLSHKPECFESERCIVEKTVVLPHRFFEAMRLHPMDDSPYIAENRKFMWNDEHGAHCVLFLDSEGDDGFLVQAEGYSYARRAQFVPGAKQLAFDAGFTMAEHRIPLSPLHERICSLCKKVPCSLSSWHCVPLGTHSGETS